MKIPCSSFSLDQFKSHLRVSYLVWIAYIVIVEGLVIGFNKSFEVALISVSWSLLPILCMLPIIWKAKNGNLLILCSLIIAIIAGATVMQMLKMGVAIGLYGIELILIFVVLFFLSWVIERMPKLQQPEL